MHEGVHIFNVQEHDFAHDDVQEPSSACNVQVPESACDGVQIASSTYTSISARDGIREINLMYTSVQVASSVCTNIQVPDSVHADVHDQIAGSAQIDFQQRAPENSPIIAKDVLGFRFDTRNSSDVLIKTNASEERWVKVVELSGRESEIALMAFQGQLEKFEDKTTSKCILNFPSLPLKRKRVWKYL